MKSIIIQHIGSYNDGGESPWIKANVAIDGGDPDATNFLHFPLGGSHTTIGISSIFDHASNSDVKTFDGSIGKLSYGRINEQSHCYKTSSGNIIELPGVKYVGVANQNRYLCYDMHKGIDYVVDDHTPVLAASSGMIVGRDDSPIAGKSGCTVVINHGNGYATAYMHMECNDRLAVGTQVS